MTHVKDKNSTKGIVILIFLLALAVRVIYLIDLKETPFYSNFTLDTEYNDALAEKIAGGEWVGKEVFFRSPVYLYFLAVIYAVFGKALTFIRVVQFVIGALSCVLLYLIGKRLFGKKAHGKCRKHRSITRTYFA